jgi:hypothetical protein
MRDLISQHPNLTWLVILNATSDANPERYFYQHQGHDAQGIWLGTPYAEWREVMPLIAPINADHPFLDWVEEQAANDWGMVVGSPTDIETVRQHFRSLTHVWMPNGQHVFFRFFDPRFGIEVATLCDAKQRTQLMGPTQIWLTNDSSVLNNEVVFEQEQAFPWWLIPENVLMALEEDDSVLVINLMNGLRDHDQALYDAYPSAVLKKKAERFASHYSDQDDQCLSSFIALINQEQQRLGRLS